MRKSGIGEMKARKGTKRYYILKWFEILKRARELGDELLNRYSNKQITYSEFQQMNFRNSYHYRWFDERSTGNKVDKTPLRDFKYHIAMFEKEIERLERFLKGE